MDGWGSTALRLKPLRGDSLQHKLNPKQFELGNLQNVGRLIGHIKRDCEKIFNTKKKHMQGSKLLPIIGHDRPNICDD